VLYATFQSGVDLQPDVVTQKMGGASVPAYLQDQPSSNPFPALIDAIGCDEFAARMMVSLYRLCGASSFSLHTYREGRQYARYFINLEGSDLFLRELLKLDPDVWRCDAMFLEGCNGLGRQGEREIRISCKTSHQDSALQAFYGRTKVQERLLICGGNQADTLNVLHIQRPDSISPLSRGEYNRLRSAAQLLFSALVKHDEISSARSNTSSPLTSHEEVVEQIAIAGTDLTQREIEVCAGILLGITSLGIALKLQIGEQTVLTYRKRLYQRLGISTQRELMLWYMGLS